MKNVLSFLLAMMVSQVLPGSILMSQSTWFDINFNEGHFPGELNYGADYSAVIENGVLAVGIQKNGRWEPFTLELDSLYDFSANPVLNIKARTDENMVLQVFLVDADRGGYQTELVGDQYKYTELVAGKNEYRQAKLLQGQDYIDITWDFSAASGTIVDLSRITKIVLTANGTAMTYNGKLHIDEIKAGDTAQKKAYIAQIPDQEVFKNASGSRNIFLPEIMNTDNIIISGGENLIQSVAVDPVNYTTATENGRVVTYGFTRIHYTVLPDSTGIDTIRLTAAGNPGFADNSVKFRLSVTGNRNPVSGHLNDITCKAGILYSIQLENISDGDPEAEQALSVSASSDNKAVLDTVMVEYTSDNQSGRLIFTPLQPGLATITVTLGDSEGASSVQSFQLTVYNNINGTPTIDPVLKTDVVHNAGEQTLILTGISDGDDGTQLLTITAESSVAGIIGQPEIEYNQGDSIALLKFTPVPGSTGVTEVTIRLTDNGGTPENDGDKSAEMAFEIETLDPPVSGYVIDLSEPDALSWFGAENQGIEYFLAIVDTLGSKALRIQMKEKWTYGGIWFQLPVELNLKKSPVVSYEVFSVQKQTWHWNYLYDAHGTDGEVNRNIQNSEDHQYAASAGNWSVILFDYRDPGDLNNSSGEPIDAGRINAVLLNMHDTKPSWPFTNATATVYYRNIRFGDSCTFAPATPACTIESTANQTVFENSGEHTLILKGISNGQGNTSGVEVTAASFNTSVIPKPVLSPISSDGTISLTFVANAEGSSDITVRVSATASATVTSQFRITVVKPDPSQDAIITVNMTETNQTVRGFGSFEFESRWGDLYTGDLGASVIRLGIIGNQWEPVNDNDDPDILNMEAFNYEAFDWDFLRQLKEDGVAYFILTSWSPPAWMKRNLSVDHKEQAVGWGYTDNRMELYYYDEFAESMLALVKALREKAGIDLLAIGLQNEPFFNEPYPSAILDAPHFIDLIKIVSAKLKSNGFDEVGFYMPEQVFGIGSADASCIGFLERLRLDPVANEVTDYFAVHGYEQTGITPGFPDFSEWQEYYEAASEEPYPKETWMTETAIGYEGWSSSMGLAGAIHGSLWAGNVSWWTVYGFPGDYISDNQPNSSFYAAKNYYKYVRPGAIRLTTGTSSGDIMPTAFINTDGSLVMVLINKSAATIAARINGSNLPDDYTSYRTSSREKFIDAGMLKLSHGGFVLPASSITTLVATGNNLLTMNQVEDQVVGINSGQIPVGITGISDGKGSVEGLTLSYDNSNEALFSEFTLSDINSDGTASITFTPAPDATGFSKVSLHLTDGEEVRFMTFFIIVSAPTGFVEVSGDVRIYPNPVKDLLNLKLPEDKYDRLRIMDNTGKVVMQRKVASERMVINTGWLDKGIYIIELSGKNNFTRSKINKY
jgi:O-glycosyl hydrolase